MQKIKTIYTDYHGIKHTIVRIDFFKAADIDNKHHAAARTARFIVWYRNNTKSLNPRARLDNFVCDINELKQLLIKP